MTSLRLSRRQKAGLAVALALLLWAPMGVSSHEQTLVTGHSTFHNGSTYDKCLASVAGLIRSRVMWFNDQVLVETYGKKGTFVYVTESNATDPTGARLYSEGVYYDFVDPNGAHWHVEEAFMIGRVNADGTYVNQNYDPRSQTNNDPGRINVDQDRTYVWIAELADRPIYDMFAGDDPANRHTLYNFLVLVDTCKMKRTNSQPEGPEHYNVTHDDPNELSTRRGHVAGETTHYHEAHQALLWFGTRPVLTPLGMTTLDDGQTYDSSWATAYPESHASGANLTQSTNNGPNNDAPSYWNESRSAEGQLDG